MNIWFTSDTHFGHKKILEYEKEFRPFSSLEEMHEVMIEKWNNVVNKKDTIYHLGDFAFGKKNIDIASRLNGIKNLIMGNHDVYPIKDYLKYFNSCRGAIFYKKCILTHVPVHENCLNYRYKINIHGHLHSKNIIKIESYSSSIIYVVNPCYINVSCEQNNLTPIHLDIINDAINKI